MKHGFFSVLSPCSFRGCKFEFRVSDFGFRISAFRGVGRKRRRGCIVHTSGRKNQDGVFRIETWWERKVQCRGGIIVYVPTGSAPCSPFRQGKQLAECQKARPSKHFLIASPHSARHMNWRKGSILREIITFCRFGCVIWREGSKGVSWIRCIAPVSFTHAHRLNCEGCPTLAEVGRDWRTGLGWPRLARGFFQCASGGTQCLLHTAK
jgi:hypothetical protein